ncbi:MAG: hypothetical protein ABFR02_00220 [Campylobacterota bacterium]
MQQLLFIIVGSLHLCAALYANEHYLLPEHKSDLMYTLKKKIDRAEHITIVTGELENPSLAKSIEKAIKRGARFHLITTHHKSAAYFAKYKNTRVHLPASRDLSEKFALNLLLIDESDVCFSTLAFSEAVVKRSIGEVICTTNREEIDFAQEIKKRFTERFEDYHQ